jgi:hypothetical protein
VLEGDEIWQRDKKEKGAAGGNGLIIKQLEGFLDREREREGKESYL